MPGNRPALVLAALLLITLFVPAVSAEILIDEDFDYYLDSSGSYSVTSGGGTTTDTQTHLYINKIEEHPTVNYIAVYTTGGSSYPAKGRYDVTYTLDSVTKPGVVYIDHSTNALGQIVGARCTFFPYEWDIGTKTGPKIITVNKTFGSHTVSGGSYYPTTGLVGAYTVRHEGLTKVMRPNGQMTFTIVSYKDFYNHLTVDNDDLNTYNVQLTRANAEGTRYISTFTALNNDSAIFSDSTATDLNLYFADWEIDRVSIDTGVGGIFVRELSGDDSSGGISAASLTVYVQSSQTGALLADADLSLLASTGGTEVEIINTTLPAGTATYTLQPTGGGLPNPDYYRAVATVPGYTQIVENHSFTLTGPHDVIIEMRPDSGGPTDPENCYLEFYVRDFSANGIASASIQCNSQFKQTNSAGYAVFEVAKNATYPYKVSKSGYVTIEGTATVADAPRYVANIVLGPGSVPTYTPTPDPSTGETPGATPTPDTRTNEQKGQAVIDMIADNAEGIGALGLLCLLVGLLKLLVK